MPHPLSKALALWATLLTFLLFLTLGSGVQLLNVGLGLWFTEGLIFFGVGWILLKGHGLSPLRATGLNRASAAACALGFAMGVANFFAFVVPIQWVAQALAPAAWQEAFDSSQIFEGQTSFELALILGGVTVAAPICEEFFFRGILQQGLMPPALRPARAITLSALLFSAFHLDPVGLVGRLELGLLFGLLFLRTGSLWPSIFAHSANNLVSTLLFFASQDTAGTSSEEAGPLFIAGMSLMGISAFALLMVYARRKPSLLPWREAPAQDPEAFLTVAPRSWGHLILPWVAGGVLALGLLWKVDARGVRLNLIDLDHPLPKSVEESLRPLRQQVRQGALSLEEYEQAREVLAKEQKEGGA